jgi:hypothetical protein
MQSPASNGEPAGRQRAGISMVRGKMQCKAWHVAHSNWLPAESADTPQISRLSVAYKRSAHLCVQK